MRHAARRTALLAALERELGDAVEVGGANAGLHVVVWLPGVRAGELRALRDLAARRDVGVQPVSPFYAARPRRAGVLLGYAALDEAEIAEGVRRFAAGAPGAPDALSGVRPPEGAALGRSRIFACFFARFRHFAGHSPHQTKPLIPGKGLPEGSGPHAHAASLSLLAALCARAVLASPPAAMALSIEAIATPFTGDRSAVEIVLTESAATSSWT